MERTFSLFSCWSLWKFVLQLPILKQINKYGVRWDKRYTKQSVSTIPNSNALYYAVLKDQDLKPIISRTSLYAIAGDDKSPFCLKWCFTVCDCPIQKLHEPRCSSKSYSVWLWGKDYKSIAVKIKKGVWVSTITLHSRKKEGRDN